MKWQVERFASVVVYLDRLPSKFGSSKGQTTQGVSQIPQKVIRDSCKAFSKRLQLVIDADGGYIVSFHSYNHFEL